MTATAFRATHQWQDIPEDAILQPGLHIRLDPNTGLRQARIPTNGAALDGLDDDYAADAPPSQTVNGSGRQQGRDWRFSERGAERFVGTPPERKWLIQGSIPLGVPALVAAMGDTGKSYLTLQLCLRVVLPPVGNLEFARPILGGTLSAHGSAVFLTSEDDEGEVWRRLDALDPNNRRAQYPGKVIVIALPSEQEGGTQFFVKGQFGGGPMATLDWESFCDACAAVPDLKVIVIDPLAAFAALSLDNDSTDAQFVSTQLGRLAARMGATVIACHHMRKGPEAPKNVSEARDRIRGSSGIVDGVRCAYALWPVDEDAGKRACRALEMPYTPNKVVAGAVVKANGPASREIATYVRTDQGLLLDRTHDIAARHPDKETLAEAFIESIGAAAEEGRPFTHTGEAGVYKQRARLRSEALRTMGRNKLEAFCRTMIDAGRIVQCMASGSHACKWLDVPGGKFARGEGEFAPGAGDV